MVQNDVECPLVFKNAIKNENNLFKSYCHMILIWPVCPDRLTYVKRITFFVYMKLAIRGLAQVTQKRLYLLQFYLPLHTQYLEYNLNVSKDFDFSKHDTL